MSESTEQTPVEAPVEGVEVPADELAAMQHEQKLLNDVVLQAQLSHLGSRVGELAREVARLSR